MAYIGTTRQRPLPQEVKEKKASPLAVAGSLAKTGVTAAKILNDRKERLLKESGDLDKSITTMDEDGKSRIFKVFERKESPKGIKGLFAPKEKNLKLTQDARNYFEDLSIKNKTMPGEEMFEYFKGLEGENSRLFKVDTGGGEYWRYGGKENFDSIAKKVNIDTPGETFKDYPRLNNQKPVKFTDPDTGEISNLMDFDKGVTKKYSGVPRKGYNPSIDNYTSIADTPLYNESLALQEAAEGAASQVSNMTGPFYNETVANMPSTSKGTSLIMPKLQPIETDNALKISTAGIKNDANRMMQKGMDFLGTPKLENTTLPSLGAEVNFLDNVGAEGTNLLNTALMKQPLNVASKIASPGAAVGSALGLAGPLGMLAGAAMDELFKDLFK
tara:strand:- start:2161 stop:3318 length:1158 start_codon:yes stop_codon:yes gene_type:complete